MSIPRHIVSTTATVCFAASAMMAQTGNGNLPEILTQYVVIAPGGGAGSCSFPVSLALNGKAKFITSPNQPGKAILTSPGLNVIVTNLTDPSKQVTLNITGSLHANEKTDGTILAKGRNLLQDPLVGVVLVIGNISFRFDEAGNMHIVSLKAGRMIDVCELID